MTLRGLLRRRRGLPRRDRALHLIAFAVVRARRVPVPVRDAADQRDRQLRARRAERRALDSPTWPPEVRLALGVGFLGAYTTFSTFTYETLRLVEAGDTRSALAYVTVSVLAGLAAATARPRLRPRLR
ncbi:MAG: CrcB family protein [Burkholderiaceae bacterium]